MRLIQVGNIRIGKGEPLVGICGPCVIESEEHSLRAASFLKQLFDSKNMPLIFKSSYKKANRSALTSFCGPGLEEGLLILEKIKREFNMPVVTDVHTPEEARAAGQVCDVLQIPAFLCRQTELILAAAETGKVVSVKKGQFMAPWDMKNVVNKIQATGNQQVILVERGSSFGYNTLVNDMRSLAIMQDLGVPVCFDATHSVQQPGSLGAETGGQREFVPLLARSAVAAGVQVVFMEAHPNPNQAPCDGPVMLAFDSVGPLLDQLLKIHEIVLNS